MCFYFLETRPEMDQKLIDSRTTTAMDASWKQQYALAVAGADADGDGKMASTGSSTNSCSKDSVVLFLESVLAPTSLSATSTSSEHKLPSLADIGKELLVPVAELSTVKLTKEQGLDRDAVMRVLQLQVICRLLCCCKKKKTTKQKGKQAGSSLLKLMKKELRSLLDRIALLLDAANPPSLTDEDERSPFHEFLQDVLAKAFTKRLPKLVKFLLTTYELEDETRAMGNLTLNPLSQTMPSVKPVEAAVAIPPAVPSILSALLRDEQRPIKRSRTETVVPFKKMEIPNELRRRSSFPSTRKDLLKAAKKTGTTTSASVSSTSTSSPAIPRSTSSSGNDKSLSRSNSKSRAAKSAEKPSLTPQSSLGQRSTSGSKGAPLLMRNVDRALFAGPQSRFTPSASNNTPHTIVTSGGPIRPLSASKHPLLATTPKNFKPVMPGAAPVVAAPAKPAGAPRTAVSNLIKNERTSVVMRTPDRPQRRPHRATRVLIESSPPFRNPNVGAGAAARQRKQPTAIPPPLLR